VQRDNGAGSNDEMTVDVIGVDDHEKENDWDPKLKDIPGWYDKINQ